MTSLPSDSNSALSLALPGRPGTNVGENRLGDRKLLTKKELAVRYGVVPRTIDNWIAQRQIPFLKLGRKLVRFDPEECDRALQRFKVEAASAV